MAPETKSKQKAEEKVISQLILNGKPANDPANNHIDLFPVREQPDKLVVYQRVGISKDPNPVNNGRMMAPGMENVPTRDSILDKNNRRVEIIFSSGYHEDANGKMVPIYEEINLIKGFLYITPQESNLFEYMERTNYNASNKRRIHTKKAIFELFDTEGKKSDELEKFLKAHEVISAFLSIAEEDISKMYAFARVLKVDTTQNAKAVKFDIMGKLQEKPSLWSKFDTPETKAISTVVEGVILGVLVKRPDLKSIGYMEEDGEYKEFIKIPGKVNDYEDFFANWLLINDGDNWLSFIKTLIEEHKAKAEDKF